MNKREAVRAQLARRFTAYSNPMRELLLGMRRAKILRGTGPAEAMEHWLEGRQPPGMSGIPVPEVDRRSEATFLRLRAERNLIPASDYVDFDVNDPVGLEAQRVRWTRARLWEAMHDVALQMADPWWMGATLAGESLPNLIDWQFACDPRGAFCRSAYDALGNVSYRIAFADEGRIPDYSGTRLMAPDTARSRLTQEVLDRRASGSPGADLGAILSKVVDARQGYRPAEETRHMIMLDLADMGIIDRGTYMESQGGGGASPSR